VIAVAEPVVLRRDRARRSAWENVAARLAARPRRHSRAHPFAIWSTSPSEGVANAAEEARAIRSATSRSARSAMATLVVLALGVFFCATGAAGWRAIVYPDATSAVPSDSPLPLAMAHAVSESSVLYAMLVGIGLFGLVASFHGILLAGGRADHGARRAVASRRAFSATSTRAPERRRSRSARTWASESRASSPGARRS
jgi:ethanolamine permease